MIFRKGKRDQTGGSPPPPLYRCSFCNKSQRDVKKLIAGPKVYICDECVDICVDIIVEDRVLEPTPTRLPEPPPVEADGEMLPNPPQNPQPVRCRLCRMVSAVNFCLPVANRGWLCGGCLDAVKEVLDASSPEA
jgi:hypothetical protein